MIATSFYSEEELLEIGFSKVGLNCKISRKACFYDIANIAIGQNTRIDDFCIISGKVNIGSYVHISAFCGLYGSYGINIDDFSGTSPNTLIFSAVDDFSGRHMIGPQVPEEYIKLHKGTVNIEKFVQIGAGSIVMPIITLKEGTAIGSLSFVNKDTESWGIYAGVPAKKIKDREKNLLDFAKLIKL